MCIIILGAVKIKGRIIDLVAGWQMGLYENNFAEAFSKLLIQSGVTCYQISQYSHLDQAYLSRLKNGEKQNPSPDTIIKISLALTHYSDKVKLYDIQKLFKSVGRSLQVAEEY